MPLRPNAGLNPPIVVHHDFSRGGFPFDLPANASFVQPHTRTHWGQINEAIVRSVSALSSSADPDWAILLSGADYPIAPAATILRELETTPFDGFIAHRRVDPASDDLWHRVMTRRYLRRIIQLPWLGRRKSLPPALSKPFLAFGPDYHCFAGLIWFTLDRAALRVLVGQHDQQRRLFTQIERAPCADEAYVQTLLGNAKGLKLSEDHRRYIRFGTGKDGAHPVQLGETDLPVLAASGKWFARKFREDDPVLDQIDKQLLGLAKQPSW